MTALSSPGAINVAVETDARGRVATARVRSSRPAGVGRLFIGSKAGVVPALASQLFSLCGFSHSAASRLAIAAACGRDVTPAEGFSIAVGLATEQIAESLRSLVLGWPGRDDAGDVVRAAAPLRDAMRAARIILAEASRGEVSAARGDLGATAGTLFQAMESLGWRPNASDAPAPGSLLAAAMDEAAADDFLSPRAPDALRPADDGAVVEALRRGGDRFAAAPTLPHRIVETGAFAHRWPETSRHASALAARLAARLLALSHSADDLKRSLRRGEACGDVWMTASVEAGEGCAAVETARGRLYHWARVDSGARIADYRLLAPTEWNFHPAGPFAAALLGAKIGAGDAARLRVRRLAAVFDPCVALELELCECGNA